jgi:hypothetical protein
LKFSIYAVGRWSPAFKADATLCRVKAGSPTDRELAPAATDIRRSATTDNVGAATGNTAHHRLAVHTLAGHLRLHLRSKLHPLASHWLASHWLASHWLASHWLATQGLSGHLSSERLILYTHCPALHAHRLPVSTTLSPHHLSLLTRLCSSLLTHGHSLTTHLLSERLTLGAHLLSKRSSLAAHLLATLAGLSSHLLAESLPQCLRRC